MPTMTHWTEKIGYSVAHDCDMARISGFDDRSQEHYLMIETGAGYRERRAEAVERLMESIEAGDPAGELK